MQVGNKDNAEKTVFFPTFGTLCSTWFWYILAKIVRAITIHNHAELSYTIPLVVV